MGMGEGEEDRALKCSRSSMGFFTIHSDVSLAVALHPIRPHDWLWRADARSASGLFIK